MNAPHPRADSLFLSSFITKYQVYYHRLWWKLPHEHIIQIWSYRVRYRQGWEANFMFAADSLFTQTGTKFPSSCQLQSSYRCATFLLHWKRLLLATNLPHVNLQLGRYVQTCSVLWRPTIPLAAKSYLIELGIAPICSSVPSAFSRETQNEDLNLSGGAWEKKGESREDRRRERREGGREGGGLINNSLYIVFILSIYGNTFSMSLVSSQVMCTMFL